MGGAIFALFIGQDKSSCSLEFLAPTDMVLILGNAIWNEIIFLKFIMKYLEMGSLCVVQLCNVLLLP